MISVQPARLLELTLPGPAENVALDEALLRISDETQAEPVLRLWELETYAVVVGRANRIEKNVDVAACRRDGVPILRRFSGGGTVLLGPGALVYSLVLPVEAGDHLAQIGTATSMILDRIRRAFDSRVGPLEQKGSSDLVSRAGKFSGNAQRWLKRTLLHHGTLLYDFDIERFERYLTLPEREPAYRQGRPHHEFVANLPLSQGELRQALRFAWNATLPPPAVPQELVGELVRSRYADEEWTMRL